LPHLSWFKGARTDNSPSDQLQEQVSEDQRTR
jgi:hypothetical protein